MDQSVTLSLPTTPEQFLAWERHQEGRHEFDGRGPVPMNGGTAAHARIERNLLRALADRLEGSGCEAFGSTMKVRIGAAYRYPDASVTCTPVPGDAVTVAEPVVLFEIVSPGSETVDRTVRLVEYRSLPSVQAYVVVEQDERVLTVHARNTGSWGMDVLNGAGLLRLPSIGVAVPVAALYAGLFPPA